MGTETWSLKLDAELKEKLQTIIKSDFDSSMDFVQELVYMYEVHKLKEAEYILSTEAAELESLTKRINRIFINANERINTVLLAKDDKATELVATKLELIERLQQNLSVIEKDKIQLISENSELIAKNTILQEEVSDLINRAKTTESLIKQNQEQNDTLINLISEYQEDREYNKKLQEQVKVLERRLEEINIVSTQQAKTIVETDTIIQGLTEKHQNELQELLTKHGDELTTLKTTSELDLNRAILRLQQEDQVKLQSLQEKHNYEVQQQQSKHAIEIEQYQEKYRSLLEQIEHIQLAQNKLLSKTEE